MRFNDCGLSTELRLLRDKLALQGVHLHIIAPRPGESIDAAMFGTMAKCDAFLAMSTKDYGAGATPQARSTKCARGRRSTIEVDGKPLIPLRMILWDNEFDHDTASALFGANLLALTWIKGESMPGWLVDDILRGLQLERRSGNQPGRRTRSIRIRGPGVDAKMEPRRADAQVAWRAGLGHKPKPRVSSQPACLSLSIESYRGPRARRSGRR